MDNFLPRSFTAPRRPLFTLLHMAVAWYAIDRGAAALIGKEVLKSQFRFSRLYRGNCNARIVVIGNSRGVNAFYAPELSNALGKDVFNLSYNGLSIKMAVLLFNDYLSRCQPPDLVIIEVTNALDAGTSVPLCQLYADQSQQLAGAWKDADPLTYWLSRIAADTFRYNGELTLRAFLYRNHSDQGWINNYQMPAGMMERYQIRQAVQAQWAKLDVEAVKELQNSVEIAHSKDLEVLLVVTPYAPGYCEQLPGFRAWVRNLEDAVGVPIHDLSDALKLRSLFADPLHMNLRGARALMPKVIRLVQKTLKHKIPNQES